MDLVLIIIAVLFIVPIFLKLYWKITMKWNGSHSCLVGKTAMVTGANTGIGYYTALDFAKRGARVILACRNTKKAEEAREKIVELTGNPNVVVKLVDLASLKSIRQFANKIVATEERLDILVNNAGLPTFHNVMTEDGLSMLMQVNYFGPFLLTNLLLDLLRKSTPSRIVNVSSLVAHIGTIHLERLHVPPNGLHIDLLDYGISKLCIVLFSNELARRLNGTDVYVNTVHPGGVRTDIFQKLTTILGKMLHVFSKLIYMTPMEGAQTSIYAAVSKDVNGIAGVFFGNCSIGFMPVKAKNMTLAKQLWQKSVEVVKLASKNRTLE